MHTPRLVRSLLLVVSVLALRPAPAHCAEPAGPDGETTPTGTQQQKTTSQLLTDLGGDNKANRLYAARALKQQLTHAQHVVDHAKEGSLQRDEALANLDELEQRLPEACEIALDSPNSVAPAAEMLAMLNVASALPHIEQVAQTETRKHVLKRLSVARAKLLVGQSKLIQMINGSGSGELPPPVEP